MRIVIIGGVAGGMSAAIRLRRLSEDNEIIVIERGGNVSFANCGLPYHVGGVIEDRSKLIVQHSAAVSQRFKLDIRENTEVTSIDAQRKELTLRAFGTEETSTLSYDKLLLAPGAAPVRPPIPGIEHALTLRNLADTDALVLATKQAKRAVIIGGGFIGIELAENLTHRGIKVTLVEALDQIISPIDPELAELVQERMVENGVELQLGRSVVEIGKDFVVLGDGTRIEADVVVSAIGVRPESDLAVAARLEVGPRGGIVVDAQLRTSDADIYAVGDVAQKLDAISGEPVLVPLAQTANRQGRRVADIIMGAPVTDKPVWGTAILGVFGLQVASAGWNEKRLRAAGRNYLAIHTHPNDHAGYYPGASQISLKLLVDPETDDILGVQGVGESGVDKRVDVIATAAQLGAKASQLAELELCYAPQFGSAKDPVNFLGWVAENHRDGLVESVQWHELADEMAAGAVLVDVRSAAEHAARAIPGSILVPLDELRERLAELPKANLIVHCAVGLRGYLACRILAEYQGEFGWPSIRNLDGGMRTWLAGTNSKKH